MKKLLFIFVLGILVMHSASALTQINIYVDSSGDSLFLGVSDENPIVPEGITISNGKVSGVSSGLTTKDGEVWNFSYHLQGAELEVILPAGAVITSLSNGDISLEKERIAIFTNDGLDVQYTVNKTRTQDNTLITVIVLAVLAFIALFVLMRYIKKNPEDKENPVETPSKLDAVKDILNDRERLIIEELKKTGKVKGSFLRKKCDIPKASFSRHLQELEKKGLVKRSGEGKNKFVELVE